MSLAAVTCYQTADAAAPGLFTVRVESAIPTLGGQVAEFLSQADFATQAKNCATDTCTLQYRTAPPRPQIAQLIERLLPFRLKASHVPELDADAVVTLGDPAVATLGDWNVQVQAEEAEFAADIAAACKSYGCKAQTGMETGFIAEPELLCGPAPAFLRAIIGWTVLRGCGVLPRQVSNRPAKDGKISLRLPMAAAATAPLRTRVPVIVRSDTPAGFAAILPLLREAGFTRIKTETLTTIATTRFRIHQGPLAACGAHIEIADLAHAMAAAGDRLGIDWARFPLEMRSGPEGRNRPVIIDLPVAAVQSGQIPPWSRFEPGSCKIKVRADDRGIGGALTAALIAAGFRAVRARLESAENGFLLRHDSDVPENHKSNVLNLIEAELLRLGAAPESMPEFEFAESERDFELGDAAPDCDIELELPVRALRQGRLSEILASATRHKIKITAPNEESAAPLAASLRAWSPRQVQVVIDPDDDPAEIAYGSARQPLLDRIETEIRRHYGPISLPQHKRWPTTDHDIFIRLPLSVAERKAVDAPCASSGIATELQCSSLPRRGRLVETDGAMLRVGELLLPRNHGPVHPRALFPGDFTGFCIDQQVAESLHFLAMALQGRHPAALEGTTAASKTHAIHFLSAQLGVGVYRTNLTSQTDVSDLLGRYVPDAERPGAFRYQFGPAPLAMTEGAWLVLDEADLAPADVIEVINPLLEPDPRLVLSQADGRMFRADAGFRVLATWNGAAYNGRQELSPAFLDRFKIRVCTPPDEADYLALAHCLLHGRQPEVVIDGARYGGETNAPALPELASLLPDCDRFLQALARFQAGVSRMELRASSGPVAYTRRAFVDVLGTMRKLLLATAGNRRASPEAAIRAAWQALSLCHLERLPAEQRAKAVALLTLCGIGQTEWELPA